MRDYVFRKHNSQGVGYYALVAAGTNAAWPHYHASQARTQDGELVLFDYAPDYKYYTSDVTRMFPVNGRFTADQRELYTIYLQLYQALMTSIRPGKGDRHPEGRRREDGCGHGVVSRSPIRSTRKPRRGSWTATAAARPRPGAAASGTWSAWKCTTSPSRSTSCKPGMIFTIEPALTIPEERVYIRLEDVILITDKGYENMSAFVPMDVAGIEKLMAETGFAEKTRKPSATTAR